MSEGEVRYGFGANWSSFSRCIDEERIRQARLSIESFLPRPKLQGARFLDIGCGSGLFSLAALELGAGRVLAIDLDPRSVETSRGLLASRVPPDRWECRTQSVFELDPERHGRFDVVYSWGVLHHTGNLALALERAAAMVAPSGLLFVALYGKTPFCRFWKWEKRMFVRYSPWFPALVRPLYKSVYLLRILASGRSPWAHVRDYKSLRGMDWSHNVDDWLGGYPYESIAEKECRARMEALGFTCLKAVTARRIGLLGSGCDEYLFERRR